MEEIWKDIEGYEGLYRVSNLGRIKSLPFEYLCGHHKTQLMLNQEKIKKLVKSRYGYLLVGLNKNGVCNKTSVHRIVAINFLENPENKKEVNHKNGIKADNRVENLEWNTPSENSKHAFRIGLKKRKKYGANGFAKIVLDTQYGIFYESAKEVSDMNGYDYVWFIKRLTGHRTNKTKYIYA